MGYEEFVYSALSRGKTYDQLPVTLQAHISYDEYQLRVRDHWIARGAEWGSCPAQQACGETEYYETLVKCYKAWYRVFPYHLSGYICRVMRVTPFRYYSDIIGAALAAEKPYHQLPNFTAADAMRILGIGRNEYIAMLNTCKGKRIMWRVNRSSVVKELLPAQPQPVKTEPWWRIGCVNLGDGEFRELGLDEMAALKSAGMPGASLLVGDISRDVFLNLWKRGLVYLEVPVQPTDRFTIPPLEGFVSNKDAAAPLGARGPGAAGPGTDPLEALLYAVFVANSERLTVDALASILSQGVPEVCTAMSLACRLGFATRVDPPSLGGSAGGRTSGSQVTGDSSRGGVSLGALLLGDEVPPTGDTPAATIIGETPRASAAGAAAAAGMESLAAQLGSPRTDGRAVAIVLDAEATSFLMMGALSPGVKRHAVTLFEGGRVAGAGVIAEFASELWSSHAQGQALEGDMAKLAQFAGALATALDITRAAAGSAYEVELLRKESLSGLQPAAAAKVLATAYCVLLPVTPLPAPPMPLALNISFAPAYFGPTAHSMSPWAALALYQAAESGPVSLALCCGQRLRRLPEELHGATHALIWTWDVETDAARAKAAGLPGLASDGGPSLVDAPLLLYTLNELLARSAVLVQPINIHAEHHNEQPGSQHSSLDGAALIPLDEDNPTDQFPAPPIAEAAVVDIPLPLLPEVATCAASATANDWIQVRGILRRTSEPVLVTVRCSALNALQQLGVATTVGMLRVIQLPGQGLDKGRVIVPPLPSDPDSPLVAVADEEGLQEVTRQLPGRWLPFSLHQGVPLYCLPLCKAVCSQAQAQGFLSSSGQARQVQAQHQLQRSLDSLIGLYATWQDAKSGNKVAGGAVGPGQVLKGSSVSYGTVELPVVNLLFEGGVLQPVDIADCLQGDGLLCL